MNTAIITGVTGQDGALLASFLLGKNYNVIGIDRRTSSKTDWRLKELGAYGYPELNVVSGDITDSSSIDRIVQQYQPDEFYNLAAMSFVKESWNTPSATMDINAIGTINCLEALRKFKQDCKFYQASSSEMFGGANRTKPLNEESTFYPRSPYGISKVAAHWAAINYRESYDMFTCCGILFNHESEFRGLEFVTRKITDGVARIKLGLEDFISLGNLDAQRDWGYAGDYVRGAWKILQQDKPDDYVLATGTARSIREFIVEALIAVGLRGYEYLNYVKQDPEFMRPADVGCLLGDAHKAEVNLGWKPIVNFTDMIQIMVDHDIRRVKNEIN